MGSKPTALPFGYAPKIGANEEIRTLTAMPGDFKSPVSSISTTLAKRASYLDAK